MKKTAQSLILTLLLVISIPLQGITIKIGTIAPERSPWGKALQELSRDWMRISDGKVQLKIYPGGIAGNEDDMIRKVRMGILGGAALSNRGLKKIYSDIYILTIPFAIRSNRELSQVLDRLKPRFEAGIEKNGFKVVIWSTSGWVNFFSKKPILSPESIRPYRISFATGEPLLTQAWKKSGFQVIPNDLKDLMMALQSGMVDVFYLPPILAASGQYFAQAPYMCDLRVAPLLGAIVVSDRIWKQIPDSYKPEMMKTARKLSERLYNDTNRLELEALATMEKHGLKINRIPPDQFHAWQEIADKGISVLLGKAFSHEIYEEFNLILKEIRESGNEN